MNKTAIKNFAIWSRNKLIADITYKAGLLGITEKEIRKPLPQSTSTVQFFDIGTKEPYSITGFEIEQRKKLVEEIQNKANQEDYKTAYKSVVEEVAYTWFNRLIAVRFMEVNDYLPTHVRVLSSESSGKLEPDLVTNPLEADLDYTPYEKDCIMQLKTDNMLDDLFRMLFIKQCNELNKVLPELFEMTNDYTELLMNVSFTDKDGLVYHLIHDIDDDDFNISKEGQVEIIGWLYQYYNTEPKDETFALLKKNVKITKERISSATQLFTPDWIVRYMVENSLGRLWLECHPNDNLKSQWKYYLDEAKQEADVQKQLDAIREVYKTIKPEDIKIIDPCMGSGHILVYAFDVLMQIYESYGYNQRDAAKSIVENNIYGLDIDNRACQLAYFSVMMKARQYNRKILFRKININLHSIQESNNIKHEHLKYFGSEMSNTEKSKAMKQIQYLLDTMKDAKEYGSIINVETLNWDLLIRFISSYNRQSQISLDSEGMGETQIQLLKLIKIAYTMSEKYDVVVTNPPYMGNRGISGVLVNYLQQNYSVSKADMYSVFIEKSLSLTKSYGYSSLVTPESWMFISSFEELRNNIVTKFCISSVNHLGYNGFDVGFGTVAFIIRKVWLINYKGIYVNLSSTESELNIEYLNKVYKGYFYIISQNDYCQLPRMPIAYWVTSKVINIFNNNKIISDFGRTRQGMATSDNNRFLRLWHEVEFNNIDFNNDGKTVSEFKWFPYNKGGGFRKWYGTASYLINWKNDGKEVKEYAAKLYGSYTRTIKNINEYFKESIAWPYITSGNRFGARFQPKGFIFDVAGSSLFTTKEYQYYLCGLLSSKLSVLFMQIINPTMNYQVGDIAKIPVIIDENNISKINILVEQNIYLSKLDWDSNETSWDFNLHPIINYKTNKISDAYDNWKNETENRFKQIKTNEIELNRIYINVYSLNEELSPEIEDKDVTIYKANLGRDIRSLISYAVGCIFGRYSLDDDGLVYAGGEWDDSKYITFIPDKDNILPITDEEYFEDDVVGLFCAFLKKTFGAETLEENLDFIAKALENTGNSSREVIRNYFLNEFFKDHCKTYSVTGSGKRPIYWLFDSGKQNGFKALIYMHRYNEDTIGNLRIDYLHKMQRVCESEISRMQETIENSNNTREVSAATKRKEKLVKQLKETKEYDEKIAHLALARIAIDLDDGVKVNYEKVQTDTDGNKLEVLAKI
ncbi:MAG: BREX-1 system adenine-specific DNA-methyltransferase PglX [Sedimentibacter sp.]